MAAGTSLEVAGNLVMLSGITVGSNATLDIDPGETVLVDSAYDATRTLTVNGTMNLAAGSFLTLDASQNYSTTQVIVNGALNASGVAFAPALRTTAPAPP